ncbi:hypothetical protein ACGF07_34065 [Kitasatospora sp. NPDC048194]|uniref:hypothetical protein n=1 Tax=Kitasatospora sp. NPDC048194 TaxID=3364045 RepID=UPI00371CA63A
MNDTRLPELPSRGGIAVRAPGPGVARPEAVAGVVPDGAEGICGEGIGPGFNAVRTVIAVNAGAGWWIALLRNTSARHALRPDRGTEPTEEVRASVRRWGARGRRRSRPAGGGEDGAQRPWRWAAQERMSPSRV